MSDENTENNNPFDEESFESDEDLSSEEINWQAIGPEFHSVEFDGPFTQCVQCNISLLEPPVDYVIQKNWHRGEVVFEYALCVKCREDLKDEMSQESFQAISEFINEKWEFAPENAESCTLCQKPKTPDGEFAIYADCLGIHMRDTMMVCAECAGQMEELLSKSTRDSFGDFMDRNFPMAPHEMDIPRPMALV